MCSRALCCRLLLSRPEHETLMWHRGKSMRSAEGEGDTGRRVLFAWMTNGYWDGSDAVVR